MEKKIGILTSGSDSPGLNAAIRSIGKGLLSQGKATMLGFQDGFKGLMENNFTTFTPDLLSGILTTGGTILGTSDDVFANMGNEILQEITDKALQVFREHQLDALICLGGKKTQEFAFELSKKGVNIITLPKSIENNVYGTDQTIGFDTAWTVAAEAVDRLHSTAYSHHRIIIVEIMGKYTGWLTLGAGITGGADVILIPEIPYDLDIISNAIIKRNKAGKRFSIIAIAAGAISKDIITFIDRSRKLSNDSKTGLAKEMAEDRLSKIRWDYKDNTILLANQLEKQTGLDTRVSILGYLLRGGVPSAGDRMLATRMGTACANLIMKNKSGVMVALRNGQITDISLSEVVNKNRSVPLDHDWILSAKSVGTCMGD
ncbi:MAG: ATP-dependent 6-phosphofructokinase [Anaerolineaceae bacterium]|nr:ATP-dependent 6-phosphofructokinase [Anaerolineaceae bacterium]